MPVVHHILEASSRANTEDRVLVRTIGGTLLVALADGAGGMRGGAYAAALFVDIVSERFDARPDIWDKSIWLDLFARADGCIAIDPFAGETTGIALAIGERGIIGASAGDSEAWLIDGPHHDDLTAAQERKRRLGSGRARPVSFARQHLRGTLLVASDGLFAYARPETICAATRSGALDECAARLRKLVELPNGSLHDDLALVLARGDIPALIQ